MRRTGFLCKQTQKMRNVIAVLILFVCTNVCLGIYPPIDPKDEPDPLKRIVGDSNVINTNHYEVMAQKKRIIEELKTLKVPTDSHEKDLRDYELDHDKHMKWVDNFCMRVRNTTCSTAAEYQALADFYDQSESTLMRVIRKQNALYKEDLDMLNNNIRPRLQHYEYVQDASCNMFWVPTQQELQRAEDE